MAISLSSIENDVWQTIYNIISNDSTVQGMVGSKVYSSYPSIFIESGSGMPMVVIHRPTISEDIVVLNGDKVYDISVEIHCVHKRAKEVKQLSDAVRNALESNKSTTESSDMSNLRIIREVEDFDFRDKLKIHYNILTLSYIWVDE